MAKTLGNTLGIAEAKVLFDAFAETLLEVQPKTL